MIKVMQVTSDSNIGGAGVVVKTIADNISEDIKLYVVVPKGAEIISRLPKRANISVIEADGISDVSFSVQGYQSLKKIIEEIEPDVVHAHSSLSARVAAKLHSKAKIINTRHCVEPLSSNIVKKVVKKIINNYFSDKMIAVSDSVWDNLIESGVPEENIVTVYNSVNKVQRMPEEELQMERQKLSVSGKTVFGYIGRLAEVKNPLAMVDIALSLKKTREDFIFLVAGDGPLMSELRTKISDNKVEEHFIVLGQINDVSWFYNVIDVLVNTSFSEALSLAILEAMSAKKPVVSFDIDSIYQLVRNNENGYLAKCYEADDYADKLLRLFDVQQIEMMGNKSEEIFDHEFGMKAFIDKTEKLYRL